MMQAYQEGRFSDLHQIRKETVDGTSDKEMAYLILGISDMKMQDFEKAFLSLCHPRFI